MHVNTNIARAVRRTEFSIMLEPAGDTKHAGRSIDDCFERGITLQYAQELKKVIEHAYPYVRVILSRFPGETLEPLQNANFANRLGIDLYISIHFFYEKEEKPKLCIYQFCYNSVTDFWQRSTSSLVFIPFDQAHIQNIQITKMYATRIKETLQERFATNFDVTGVYAIPFKPLIGITAPAIGIEASIATKDNWQLYIQPLVESLQSIIEQGSHKT